MIEREAHLNCKAGVSREMLYDEVWAEPMTTVAIKYGVSSSFLARICSRLNIPRPPRGYWAMFAAGRKMKRPPLPPPKPGDELEWARYGQARRAPMPLPRPPEGNKRRHVRKELPARHPLLRGAEEILQEGRESDRGFVKPQKRRVVDVFASKEMIDQALDVANHLFLQLERRGYSVQIASRSQELYRHGLPRLQGTLHDSDLWAPSAPTVVFIGTVAIGLTIFEMTEEVEVRWQNGKYVRLSDLPPKKTRAYESNSWTTTRQFPSGKLCLQAFSPYMGTAWQRQWLEKKPGELSRKSLSIVRELEHEAKTIAKLVEEAKLKAELERQRQEEQHRKWLREEEERRRIRAEEDSRKELFSIISSWTEARRIEQFFTDAEERAKLLPNGEKQIMLERLKSAREFIGGTDALWRFMKWKTPEER